MSLSVKPVIMEQLGHLDQLDLGNGLNLAPLALFLGRVVLGVALGGEVAPQAHRDRAGGDLGQAGGDDDPGLVYRAGEPGRQRERDGQAVRHPDHDVADELAGGEVALDVAGLVHVIAVPGVLAAASSTLYRPGGLQASR